MVTVNDKFAEGLREALADRATALEGGDPPPLSLGEARAAQLPEAAIAAAAAGALGVPYVESLNGAVASPEFISTVPIAFARRHALLGLAGENGGLSLALCDPGTWPQAQGLAKLLGKRLHPLFAPRAEVVRAINAAYQTQNGRAQQAIEELGRAGQDDRAAAGGGAEDLLDVASRAPVIKLVNLILFEAVKQRASDVRIQPYEDRLVVRFRVDGILRDMFQPPKALQDEIVSRIKVMGHMNIAERRLAQDGRATVEVGDRVADLRIATLPTSFGERVVLRLLDKSLRLYELGELGMPPAVLGHFKHLVHQDHGMILVTGPTGSGKTTTLYAALQEVNSQEMNIITLEDPIEYRLDGISQTQVSDKKGMTFASGLRHVVRQDPDVIMVGEVRDPETAHMAIQSALTGHLVFSTLHTNDASGAMARMLDLGVEPYLLTSSLLAVLAQRLVRRVCPECKEDYRPVAGDLARWGVADPGALPPRLVRGKGCNACMGTGYVERVGIFELLAVDEAAREMVLQRAKASTIKAAAVRRGMLTLRADGIAKAAAGVTTMDEVARVTGRDEF
ncbi:MAG: type II secretion system protein GspE [Planctomycetes bacterium]|nr:type II secretion system protein GspE [Planctomycetota bacterium]